MKGFNCASGKLRPLAREVNTLEVERRIERFNLNSESTASRTVCDGGAGRVGASLSAMAYLLTGPYSVVSSALINLAVSVEMRPEAGREYESAF